MATDLTKPRLDLPSRMSTQQITQEAMALPLAERVMLAQVLWESIHGALEEDDLDKTLYHELKAGAEAPLSDFVTFEVEAIIQQGKQRRAAR